MDWLPGEVWPILIGGAVIITALSASTHDKYATRAAGVILAALCAVQVKKLLLTGDTVSFVGGATIWLIACVAIPRQYGHKAIYIKVLLGMVVVCSLWARVVDAPRVVGSIPFMVADVLIIAALALIGARVVPCFIHRVSELAAGSRRRGYGRGAACLSGEKIYGPHPEEIGAHYARR